MQPNPVAFAVDEEGDKPVFSDRRFWQRHRSTGVYNTSQGGGKVITNEEVHQAAIRLWLHQRHANQCPRGIAFAVGEDGHFAITTVFVTQRRRKNTLIEGSRSVKIDGWNFKPADRGMHKRSP